jgi:hypothetical protein
MRILDALVKALEARGHPLRMIETDGRLEMRVTVLDEELAFRLEEEVEGREGPMTREQKKHLEVYGSYDRKIDYFPTGRPRLRITGDGYQGERELWGDAETRRLEDCLNGFIIGHARAAQGSKRERAEQEQYERTREFVQAVETAVNGRQGSIEPDGNLFLWLSWARNRADASDPLLKWSPVFKRRGRIMDSIDSNAKRRRKEEREKARNTVPTCSRSPTGK